MSQPPNILVVEDEPSLLLTLTDRLSSEGYEVTSSSNGTEALELAAGDPFDLIVLDIALPGANGLDVCRDLRQQGLDTPILMLTARSQTVDKVLGLKLGADDYLTKPFEMMELLARVEALLRRHRASSDPSARPATHTILNVSIDQPGAVVTVDDEPVDVSALEFRLLCYLAEHRGEVISRDRLLSEVWGYGADVYSRTVDVHVASLRRKIESDPARPRIIVTVHGLGYKIPA